VGADLDDRQNHHDFHQYICWFVGICYNICNLFKQISLQIEAKPSHWEQPIDYTAPHALLTCRYLKLNFYSYFWFLVLAAPLLPTIGFLLGSQQCVLGMQSCASLPLTPQTQWQYFLCKALFASEKICKLHVSYELCQ
jgi:hypothetical protein